ncbi:MAG: DUF1684 domain-containing protein [Candidatus Dormiibacterota bacterium]
MSDLEEFRKEKDEFFRTDHHSPLPHELTHHFEGLQYFPENSDLMVVSELEPPAERGKVTMETSTGESQVYDRAGVVRFEVDGQPAEVTLYQPAGEDRLFLPFRDALSGKETYGAGRYLDIAPPHNGHVVVDFNYAYNPSCAYNPEVSCPLPPRENWLQVPIRAGEKDFPQDEAH